MNETTISITVGVLSGVLTSSLIWFSIQAFQKILIPWYQKTIYRGVDISGEWIAKHEFLGGVESEQNLEIKQLGHSIKGILISRNKIPGKEERTTSFAISGEVFDNYVDLEYKVNDKKYIGRGSILVKVKEGGEKLEGALVAIDRLSTEIISLGSISWRRKDNR